MSRRARCSLAVLLMMVGPACAQIDPIPIMVTYELKKQRRALRAAERNPKAFWIRQVLSRIEDRKLDPPKSLKQAAIVKLSFVLGRDGRLVSRSVTQSSGSPLADKTAIATVERAQPFPPMPETMSDSEMTFNMPVRFR